MSMKKIEINSGGNMENEEEYKKFEFIIFCIEVFKEGMHLEGGYVYQLFLDNGVLDYLYNGYDMLHTQGDKWLINDILVFLKNRNVIL